MALAVCALSSPTLAGTASAITSSPAVSMLPEDINSISRIEKYLNSIRAMSAGFVQVNDAGEMRHGHLSIKRPGKMRVVYDPPDQDIIVADGTYLHMWDADMGQQTNVSQEDNVSSFILRDNIRLSGDVTVTGFKRFPAKLEVSLVSAKDAGEGELTLIFEDNPLRLRQWRIVDAQGRMTGVSLENMSVNESFPPGTFSFVPPDADVRGTPRGRKNR